MNDKFASQLRQHLLKAADERPADGQLAAITERVAATPQRRTLAARLTWNPGRIGPFPTAAFRFGLVALALIGALVAAALYSAGGPRARTVFEGMWASIDAADGSTQTLAVGAGAAPTIQFVDNFATGLACRDNAVKVFRADGHGTITGNQLDAAFPDGGGCGSMTVEVGPWTFTHQAATDTIVDGDGFTWTRVRDGDVPPTPGPTTNVTPEGTPAPEPTTAATPEPSEAATTCIEFDAETAYTGRVGTLPVTLTVPGAAGAPWSGEIDTFGLRKATCDGPGMPLIKASLVARLYPDACQWKDAIVDVPTAFDAAQAIGAQTGHDTVGPVESHLGAFPATRYDFSVPSTFDVDTCDLADDGFHYLRLWGDEIMVPGTTVQVYIADVDGLTLVVKASYFTAEVTQADLDQLDAMLASLRIDS